MRIAVNQELLNLETFLDQCPSLYMDSKVSRKMRGKKNASVEVDGGSSMLMIITFHSLEEKMVS